MRNLVEYNTDWKKLFKAESKNIKKNIGKNCASVVHIGSTAIKGALSVPVIDMMLLIKDDNLKEITCAILEDMGYIENGNVFLKETTDISYSLRLLNMKNEDECVKYTSIVRYLENNKDSLVKYNEKKREVYAITDEEKYVEERKFFFDDLQVKAMNWYKEQEHIAECISIGMCLGMSIGLLFFDSLTSGMMLGVLAGYFIGKYGDKEIDFKFGKKK